MKGYRKIFIGIFSLLWASGMALAFQKNTAVLIPLFSFAGTVITTLFAANWLEHREERNHES